MVEELKLAIKIDDASVEQSLLKQFENAQKMADKVVFTFSNINLADKNIEKQFKEMQKLAGKNPIELPINTEKAIKMLSSLGDEFTKILDITKGKSFIDSSIISSETNKATKSLENGFSNSINSVKGKFEELKSELTELENLYNKIGKGKYSKQYGKYVDNHSNNYVDLSGYGDVEKNKQSFDYLEGKLKEIYNLYNNVNTAIEKHNGWFNGVQYNSSDLNQMTLDFKSIAQAYYELNPSQMNKTFKEMSEALNTPVEKVKTLKQVTSKMSAEFKSYISEVMTDSNNVKANNKLFEEETQRLLKENEVTIKSYLELRDKILSKIPNQSDRLRISDYLPYINDVLPDFSNMVNFGTDEFTNKHIDVLKEICSILGIEIPNAAEKTEASLKNNSAIQSQEKIQDELRKTETQAKETTQAVKEVTSALTQESNISSGRKDAFPKTSENLEQVAKSEQKVQQEAKSIQSKWEQAEKAIHNYMNAVTKLNNLKTSDKGTGKKSYEIAGQIEEIEKLKKEAYDARQVLSSMINPHNVDTDTWKRYVDVIKQLDQASNGSAESVNRLKDSLKNTLNSELNSLQGSIDKYQKIITQAKTYPSDFKPSTEYNTKLANLDSANNALKDYKASLQGVNELTKEQQNQINKLTQNCEKAATEFKNLSAAEKGTIKIGVEKAIQRINKDLTENTRYSAKAKAGLNALLMQLKSGDPSINLRKITEEIIKIENAEIAAGRAGKSLWDIFKTKSTYGFIGQMQSYLSMYVGFYGMVNAVKKSISTITELDTALVDLKKTTAMNENQLENFYYDSNNVAKQMGVTTKEIIDQASAWSRLGYNTAETSTTMAKLSSQFASISPGMSTDEAQEGLVSIMKAFDIDPNDVETEIMDKVNVLGNNFAENNQDVVEGLKRSAAAMSAMGQSFTDTAALFTGGMEILQDSESMGTALRTLSMRIRGYDEETNQLSDDLVNVTGEVADLTKTTKNAQGISLFTDASQEHYKSMVQYLGEIADEWDLISEKNQTELLQKLFGKNRANESVCPYVQKCA